MKYGDALYRAAVDCSKRLKATFTDGDFSRALLLAEEEIENWKSGSRVRMLEKALKEAQDKHDELLKHVKDTTYGTH